MRKASPRKERKKLYTMPLHRRRSLVSAHVAKDIRESVGKRAVPLKKGYKVRVVRGKHRGKEGAVLRVSYVNGVAYVEGITMTSAKGQEKPKPLSPSNLIIISVGA
ncbi:MAG: 50S ribosomal protein L24 [Methanobacteriota archaeon]|nr:MAG: 50S ribosomal protein L24 [Euryarchaeota archaeon]